MSASQPRVFIDDRCHQFGDLAVTAFPQGAERPCGADNRQVTHIIPRRDLGELVGHTGTTGNTRHKTLGIFQNTFEHGLRAAHFPQHVNIDRALAIGDLISLADLFGAAINAITDQLFMTLAAGLLGIDLRDDVSVFIGAVGVDCTDCADAARSSPRAGAGMIRRGNPLAAFNQRPDFASAINDRVQPFECHYVNRPWFATLEYASASFPVASHLCPLAWFDVCRFRSCSACLELCIVSCKLGRILECNKLETDLTELARQKQGINPVLVCRAVYIHNNHLAIGVERRPKAPEERVRFLNLVIHMHEENPVKAVFGQARIIRCAQLDRNIVEPFLLNPVAKPFERLPVNILRKHPSFLTNTFGKADGIIPFPGTDICDGHARLDLREVHDLLRLTPAIAGSFSRKLIGTQRRNGPVRFGKVLGTVGPRTVQSIAAGKARRHQRHHK